MATTLNDDTATSTSTMDSAPTICDALQYGPLRPPVQSQKNEFTAQDLSQLPLFMSSLDDVPEGTNDAIEALKALAYEGEPHEIAENFRQQGNESYRSKYWRDAIEFYTKALAIGCNVDEINGACYSNRAACNLELRNYRKTNLDCAEALRLNPRNIKALYRSARACLALDKISEAEDCVQRGLAIDKSNSSFKAIDEKISSRKSVLARLQQTSQERERLSKMKEAALKRALEARHVIQRITSARHLDLSEDATVQLQDPLDPQSDLCFPVVVLYPLHLQSDFIKSLSENETIGSQLEGILSPSNLPEWDKESEYAYPGVDVLVEKKKYDMHGRPSLSKIGPKTSLRKVLTEGKLELIDGILTVLVVPKPRLAEFVKSWKEDNPN
ncbi:hypothetical protein AOL_s00109g194 [Orbilia oligospora ATCC 24927]|uniref:Cns1/TTC4 wheel domain-containing protein n=1 Tax=Arthrobotrys oligospora (strain ATCC 24927 / CBS 115.81 / DSM 1491) TaxID=756982 RepID=G1XKG5_ARTOA|nr:hypothetical protein AOL_s00109g194 [Orbilia oligospora ATCC 24927]EGX46353.1 hypothetical protein AOL_s00109g194 [Orbilia oligospora ATCC 24927]